MGVSLLIRNCRIEVDIRVDVGAVDLDVELAAICPIAIYPVSNRNDLLDLVELGGASLFAVGIEEMDDTAFGIVGIIFDGQAAARVDRIGRTTQVQNVDVAVVVVFAYPWS